ncbi:hypothetical protein DYU11_12050 [Fibrisoma montanum]|uniref:Uncharacterized protein n=1 Tax=Fibrisoma montanum TaxID=2305895 RepID=A0A418MBH1_9BACT|nr:hypothetical protein [Fibrisoma montanum]RIV23704.1 hypothetical protein DYU11_12050 [Fibrisoma montanum]
MVEVFKTNVRDPKRARALLDQIHGTFIGYTASFDLEDCDNILRVACATRSINVATLRGFLGQLGCEAEVLPDDVPPAPLPGADWHLTPSA